MEHSRSLSSGSTSTAPAESPVLFEKAFKRKFEDAIHSLDEAVRPSSVDVPPASKRLKISRSLYSTLAKYGIKKEPKPNTPSVSRMDSLAKNAPHLVAILTRSASRKRKPLPFEPGQLSSAVTSTSPGSDYRPSSTASFITRLATFKLTTYANKPPAIDAVAAARCGWINDGKDRLVCGICAVSWVVAGTSGMSRDAANTLVEKQRASLVDMHKDGCPWKSRQCEASIYRVPLLMPAAMVKELKERAMKLDLVMKGVQIKHPLTSAQMQQYLSIMHSVTLPNSESSNAAPATSLNAGVVLPTEHQDPSDSALLTALFGWSTVLPSAPEHPQSSASRAPSVMPSLPSTPVRPRLPSATPSRNTTPSLTRSRPSLTNGVSSSPGTYDEAAKIKADATLLFCSLCQRRVGLWAFLPNPHTNGEPTPLPSGPSLAGESQTQPRRQFDILKEHRSYCPYVVRSTVVPTLPVYPSAQTGNLPNRPFTSASTPTLAQRNGQAGAIEGWRAVMAVVSRHGSAQRHRLGRSRSLRSAETRDTEMRDPGADSADAPGEVDAVQAMVESVKARGSKDLLQYVKGLLG